MKKQYFNIKLVSPLDDLAKTQKITQFLNQPNSNYLFFGEYPSEIECNLQARLNNIKLQEIISKFYTTQNYGVPSVMLTSPEPFLEKIKQNQKVLKAKFNVENIKLCRVQVISKHNLTKSLNKLQNRCIFVNKIIGIFNSNGYLNDESSFQISECFINDGGFSVSVYKEQSNFIITDGSMNLDAFLYESITDNLTFYSIMDYSYTAKNSETSHYINAVMIDFFL